MALKAVRACRQVSVELLDKARGASKALQACLAALSDGGSHDAVREALGMDAQTLQTDQRLGEDAAASAALQKVGPSPSCQGPMCIPISHSHLSLRHTQTLCIRMS